ncbi:hypothetical protein BDZ97DRAFT_1934357 [Flammula alnicola]|nr:hypothetical protein BDZ97DRAFT_1934357 [Flammula alnicola]
MPGGIWCVAHPLLPFAIAYGDSVFVFDPQYEHYREKVEHQPWPPAQRLSLSIACLATLARRPNEVGARTGIALAISSFGALGAAPSQGTLLTDMFLWDKPIIFSGSMLAASAVCFIAARAYLVKERSTQKV